MNREQHLQWCKDRALAYLPDNPASALTSMVSDLRKHPQTEGSAEQLGVLGMLDVGDPERMRKFIEGFN